MVELICESKRDKVAKSLILSLYIVNYQQGESVNLEYYD
jgi:hypothetical protein